METELKLDLQPQDADALARAPLLAAVGPGEDRQLRSSYHDTVDGTLRRAGLTLRVRTDGARRIQTVKAEGEAAGLFVRPEWEMDVPGDTPVIDAAAGPIATVLKGAPVAECFATEVRRTLWTIDRDDGRVEVALDRGLVRAGGDSLPLCELELELKAGSAAALFAVARALDGAVPLRLGMRTKAARGFALADGGSPAASRAEPIMLRPDMGVADAFAAIAGSCLRQFRLNEALLLDGNADPRPLHQARVGLRRLRSAIALFKPLFGEEARASLLAADLRALAAALGEVRDLDVLLGGCDDAVREQLAGLRAEAFGHARATLERPETRHLMLDLAEWLAIGAWRTDPCDPGLAHGAIRPFAADLLRRRRKRLKRQGADLARLGDHSRHQVRIEGKKLRYAAEFFASLWADGKAGRRRERFLQALEILQDDLGLLNDAATAQALLHRLGLAEPSTPAEPDRRALKRAERALDDLLEVKAFWR